MKYNFDEIIDRTGSDDFKHGVLLERWKREDLLPLWVADMDFATPPFIIDAIKKRTEHPIFGYTMLPKDYWEVIGKWTKGHHNWDIKKEWLTFIPGIVSGIAMIINIFTEEGDKVIIQPPVYYPFKLVTIGNKRKIVDNPLKRIEEGLYEMDFEHLESICDERCKLLILCNPHNPAGIVWSKETLKNLADFCHKKGILVISDEIHCDMALFNNKHIPFATVSEEARNISITFAAPTKTFNIAGIVSSYAIVPNDELRTKFYNWLEANALSHPTIFASIATMAAFSEKGEEWRKEMLTYIEDNIKYIEEYCKENIPQIKPLRPGASFLIWLDCKDLKLNHEELIDLFVDKAHLALNDGETFGKGGEGYMRLNVGTPRAILKQAMKQLKEAVSKRF